MIVRQIAISDIAALASFARWTYETAFGASFSATDLAHHLRTRLSDDYFRDAMKRDDFLVAEDAQALRGFVQFGDATLGLAAPGDQELRRLYVHPDHQGQGIGTTLLTFALASARIRAARNVFLDVWEKNVRAVALYERHGFTVAGSRPLVVASGTAESHDLIMLRPQSQPIA